MASTKGTTNSAYSSLAPGHHRSGGDAGQRHHGGDREVDAARDHKDGLGGDGESPMQHRPHQLVYQPGYAMQSMRMGLAARPPLHLTLAVAGAVVLGSFLSKFPAMEWLRVARRTLTGRLCRLCHPDVAVSRRCVGKRLGRMSTAAPHAAPNTALPAAQSSQM
ncbi:hypothetical protein [Mesorhizobium sp. SARCC-RB16n]|uniref:hypothetical protein n=1 Tax=Mesorhizobium sp. SARCC-RB16n TaxID=2116687 RepID=UPI001FED6A67|nr:hypothetical protein [Mesorhizobium sp. SARCC-RB16n]